MSPRPRTPLPFDAVFTRADLHTTGLSEHVLQGWVLRGEVVKVGPGVFRPAHLPQDESTSRMWPNWQTRDGWRVLTVAGAAVRHGLPQPPRMPSAHSVGRQRRVIPERFLEPDGKWLVPSLAWTAVALARWQAVPYALISLDAALRAGVAEAELRAVVDSMESWPGARRLGMALALADGRSESPLESVSRGWLAVNKLPMPVLQHEVVVDGWLFRADMAWLEHRVIGEADGLGKYTGKQAIADEKRRQSLLQSAGFVVLRWGWQDVHPDPRGWLTAIRSSMR